MIPWDYFPYTEVRPGQKELITDIWQALHDRVPIIAHAPTGLGKTVSALSMALAVARSSKSVVLFLTNRHTQHLIALETIQAISQHRNEKIACTDLIGKRWLCSQDIALLFRSEFTDYCKTVVEKGECSYYQRVREKKELSIDAQLFLKTITEPLSAQQLQVRCQASELCGYEITLELAKGAEIIIGDYNHFFHPQVRSSLLQKLNRSVEELIVIVDEAHNVSGRIIEMASSQLTSFMCRTAQMEAKKFGYEEVGQKISALADHICASSSEYESLVPLSLLTITEPFLDELATIADEIRKQQHKSAIGGIHTFLLNWIDDSSGFCRVLEKPRKDAFILRKACLDPSIYTTDIFSRAKGVIVMSGTLEPLAMYKDILGLKTARLCAYPSPFPLENKRWMIVPQTTTKYASRSQVMYEQIAQHCSRIIEAVPGNIALFFPSYDLRDHIGNYLTIRKALFWEKPDTPSSERELLLRQFQASRLQGAVLLAVNGGSFAEGIDFPGDLLQAVVVVGLPLGKPTLLTKQLIAYYNDRFGKGWEYAYIFPAMNKCFQSAGRCIRSEKDRGVVVFLDERFVEKIYYASFPREGVLVTESYEELISSFFNKK